MGEFLGFCIHTGEKLLKIWAKFTGRVIDCAAKLFGQGVKATARNCKKCVQPQSKRIAVCAASIAAIAAIICAATKED